MEYLIKNMIQRILTGRTVVYTRIFPHIHILEFIDPIFCDIFKYTQFEYFELDERASESYVILMDMINTYNSYIRTHGGTV